MKKVFIFIIAVISIVIFLDIFFGLLINPYIKNKSLPGDYKSIDYVIKKSTDDILIIGNSIALNSIIPSIIEDSLHMTCYNGGASGQDIVFYKTMLDCVFKRHIPKMVILTLTPTALEGRGIGLRYNILIPYYNLGYNTIDSCLNSQSKIEPYLLKSNFYRYNSIWWRIALYHLISVHEDDKKGFITHSKPLYPVQLKTLSYYNKATEEYAQVFNDIIDMCQYNGVKLVVNFPSQYTIYEKGITGSIEYAKQTCKERNIPCFINFQDSLFLKHPEWFYDDVHQLEEGAIQYTKLLIKQIKQYF